MFSVPGGHQEEENVGTIMNYDDSSQNLIDALLRSGHMASDYDLQDILNCLDEKSLSEVLKAKRGWRYFAKAYADKIPLFLKARICKVCLSSMVLKNSSY